jgi:hypothetical protein
VKWYCPPGSRGGDGTPWCDDLPCKGHRARKDQVLAAEVLAWQDGYDDPGGLPDNEFDLYLQTAAIALHDRGADR